MLQQTFKTILFDYTNSEKLCVDYWNEIEKYYCGNKRYYHNLDHLENMLQQLLICKSSVNDWDTLLLALYYHDIIYNTTKKDNEERSALLAVTRLATIKYSPGRSALCSQHILATKSHGVSKNKDTNFLTDADLSILGADSETYFIYTSQIRKEYSIYPDFMYKPGRRKVLQHFLLMERIYKTDHFFNLYEHQAKENMSLELQTL